MNVSEDELAPLVALSRACQSVQSWAHSCQVDIDQDDHGVLVKGRRLKLASELTTLQAAIARAEDALG